MKKIIAILMVLAVLACAMGMIAAATETPTISVGTVVGAPGDEVSVDITIAGNPGLAFLKLKLGYDSEALTLVSAEATDVIEGKYTASKKLDVNPYVMTWTNDSNSAEDGVIVTLVFKINADAKSADYALTLNIVECYNEEFDDVTFEGVNGTVTADPCVEGHTYDDGVVTTEPTCTDKGVKTYTCSVCGATKTEEVAATGHNHTSEVTTAPTCTEKGVKTYTCTCGDTYTEEVAALGHTAGAEATCTTAQVCTECNAELAPAKGHTAGAEATCTTAQTCTVCNAELAPAKGHTAGAAATCTTAQTCTVCNAELAAAKGHTYTTAVTEPTCTEKGVKTETCACGDVKTTELPATGHTEVADAAVAPTCTTAGKTAGKHCSVCNTVLEAQNEVPATGHTYTAVVTDPTCTENGSKVETCACGDVKTTELPATGHADANKDHKCDTCDTTLSEHADADNDSKCDHCGAVVTPPPETGDMISVVAAVAFIAAMSIVALPKAKKF